MKIRQVALIAISAVLCALLPLSPASSQTSPQGYTGQAMTPSADTIPYGRGVVSVDGQLPGAAVPKGVNIQSGFGLLPGVEVIGRLATQDISCNLFVARACPPNTIRDFSASIKLGLPLPWGDSGPRAALGVTDLGGAATYFRSQYWVASQRFGPFDVSLGQARRSIPTAPLDGFFSALSAHVSEDFTVRLESVERQRWLSAHWQPFEFSNGVAPAITYTKRLADSALTDSQWWGVSLSLPLDGVPLTKAGRERSRQYIVSRRPRDLPSLLEDRGFYTSSIQDTPTGLILTVENQSYSWNAIDAAAHALSALVSSHFESLSRRFVLQVTQRGLPVAQLKGSLQCAKDWLEAAKPCDEPEGLVYVAPSGAQVGSRWSWTNLRPELTVSPLISSLIGSEAGAFDYDLAMNANLTVPLYSGGIVEISRQFPLKANTDDFDKGGPFYSARFRTATTRKLFHHYHHIPQLQTHIKASLGTINTVWDGWQLETYSASQSGAHRLSLSTGRFENEALKGPSAVRTPQLLSYRYMPSAWPVVDSELTLGEFWGGDSGYVFTQRFWFGDTTLSAYLRRSKMPNQADYVSFFGFRVTVPLTPRVLRTGPFVGIRGTSQFNYAAETKVFEKDNKITPGYGVIPNVGEPLAVSLNRDRMGTAYLNANRYRLHSAFQE